MKKTLLLILITILPSYLFTEDILTLKTLLNLAIERNPKIKSLLANLEAQKYRISVEKSLPDPMIGFSLENIGLDRFSVGKEIMSGVGVSFSQKIPFPGKLKLKGEISEKRALRIEENLKSFTLFLKGRIKELYSKLFFYHKVVEILAKKREVLEKALKTAEARYSVGKGVQSDIFKAQVEISKNDEELILVKPMIKALEGEINSLIDFPPDKPLGKPEEIPLWELKIGLNELLEEAGRMAPTIKEAELRIEESRKEVELSKKEFYPDFTIQAGKNFKGPFKDMYEIMLGVEVPVYYKRKQMNILRESISSLNSSQNNYISTKNEIFFMINENFVMAKASENLIRLYKERIIPQATLSLESSLSNYSVGRVDFLTLLSDINNLFLYEMDYFKELTNLWIYVAKIEALVPIEIIKEN